MQNYLQLTRGKENNENVAQRPGVMNKMREKGYEAGAPAVQRLGQCIQRGGLLKVPSVQ